MVRTQSGQAEEDGYSMSPEQYIQELQKRLQADECDTRWETDPATVLIGARSDFRVQWVGTKLHLFTIATVVPEVTLPTLEQFTDFAITTAIEDGKRLPRGLQTGIAVFPSLISEKVDPAALERAARWQKVRFACIARPTVVDTTTRAIGAYRGTPVAGILYASHLRKKNERYFPQPQ
jgi:hypothetical protein